MLCVYVRDLKCLYLCSFCRYLPSPYQAASELALRSPLASQAASPGHPSSPQSCLILFIHKSWLAEEMRGSGTKALPRTALGLQFTLEAQPGFQLLPLPHISHVPALTLLFQKHPLMSAVIKVLQDYILGQGVHKHAKNNNKKTKPKQTNKM